MRNIDTNIAHIFCLIYNVLNRSAIAKANFQNAMARPDVEELNCSSIPLTIVGIEIFSNSKADFAFGISELASPLGRGEMINLRHGEDLDHWHWNSEMSPN